MLKECLVGRMAIKPAVPKDSLVTIVIYTKQKDINLDSVIVDHQDDSFRAETIIKDYSYIIHMGKYFILMETTPVSFKVGNNLVYSLGSYNILSDIVNWFVTFDQFLFCFFFILMIGLGNGSMTSFFPSLSNWMQSKSVII
ncbi:hypothetical protein GH733_000547 [Mirounga leonina]|nr:hypothetical protein GH733_000547 [Mirounga leonina]